MLVPTSAPRPAQDHVIVLAAGRGRRAGGPKALHRVGNMLWWEVQQARLELVNLPVIWVVSEHVLARMRESATPLPAHLIVADETAPMFASVVCGVKAMDEISTAPSDAPPISAPARGLFILPVDVPAPSPSAFQALSAALATAPDANGATPTFNSTRGHPVYLGQRFVRSHLLGITPTPAMRLDHLIGPSRLEVPVNDPGVLVNLNTAEEFDRWMRQA